MFCLLQHPAITKGITVPSVHFLTGESFHSSLIQPYFTCNTNMSAGVSVSHKTVEALDIGEQLATKDLQTCTSDLCVCVCIQGDSGGICITLGSDRMSDSKQKSSYEHGSDFERLRSYGHFLIPVYALV